MRAVIWTASILALAAQTSAAVIARLARWSSKSVGPDGPWNVVEISLGRNQQTLSLFPGRQWQTVVVTSDYWSLNSSISHCDAGAYSKDRTIQNQLDGVLTKSPATDAIRGVPMAGPDLSIFYDDCDIVGAVPNCSLSLVDTQMLRYPSGQWYPLFAGCLSLGASGINQTYSTSAADISASIYPWWLENNTIPSSSFGVHIGSAAVGAAVGGSLSFGGYDKNRIAGAVLTSIGNFTDEIHLKDVAIQSLKESSPFGFQAKTGLLAAGNSSIPATGLNVSLDGCSPYLTLPQSTCDAITSYLPVIFNSSLGLYLWNTTDPKYKSILSSASALSFTLNGPTNSQSITINIPFQHLNLTLNPPLVGSDMQYFPCFTSGTGGYVLGRAFMQGAFVGASWDNGVWWLAQAPGPDIPPNPNVINLALSDVSLSGNGTAWEATWDKTWSSLAAQSSPSGLSIGAKTGIGIGAGVGGLVLIVAAGWLFRPKYHKIKTRQESKPALEKATAETYELKVTLGGYGPVEVPGTTPTPKQQAQLYELE